MSMIKNINGAHGEVGMVYKSFLFVFFATTFLSLNGVCALTPAFIENKLHNPKMDTQTREALVQKGYHLIRLIRPCQKR